MVHSRSLVRFVMFAGLALAATGVWAADPYIGYVYPAGGRQGTTVRLNIGGQNLGGVRDVIVTGGGVTGTLVAFEDAGGPLNALQREALKKKLGDLIAERSGGRFGQGLSTQKGKTDISDEQLANVKLPNIPELQNLESLNVRQLRQLSDKYLNRGKKPKPPIGETAVMDLTIDANAAPGDREIRLLCTRGISNPMVFQIGAISEAVEALDDDLKPAPVGPQDPPVTVNGTVMPGETDSYQLQLKKGQKLVVAAFARHLIPYLADAVPGWFQSFIGLYNSNGREIASADHCGFDPDPLLRCEIPEDGTYTLRVRDTLYRGRKDFVYRVVVADEAACSAILATGSRGGVSIGTSRQNDAFAAGSKALQSFLTSPIAEASEVEPNNSGQQSQKVILPAVLRGGISRPGDVDVYKFYGKAGDEVVAEVYAGRLGSAMDSLVRLIDSAGKVVASNDDTKDAAAGLVTHQTDSYITAKLPAAGVYFVQVSDPQQSGGPGHNYYLRVSGKRPGYSLFVSPSSINIAPGGSAPVTVHVVRRDGWNGEVSVALKDAPNGFTLSGGRIAPGRDSIRMTIAAPRARVMQPFVMRIEGSASISGKTVTCEAVPAENRMQAFAYMHLVPSQQLMGAVTAARNTASFTIGQTDPLKLHAGSQANLQVTARQADQRIQLQLNEPPAGVTLTDVKSTGGSITCSIKVDPKQAPFADNLIIEAFAEVDGKRDGKSTGQKQRVSLGYLPAVPVEVTKP